MVVEGPFDDRVDAALQLVRGRRQPEGGVGSARKVAHFGSWPSMAR